MNYLPTESDWSLEFLMGLSEDALLLRTRTAIGSLAVSRLYLGRCLLAQESHSLEWRSGYSSTLHLAYCLGVNRRTAREARRVAEALQDLPLLRAAAEEGSVPWTALRAIVSKATADTEGRWLELSRQLGADAVERLVARTPDEGEPRVDPATGPEPAAIKLTFHLTPEVMLMFQETVQSFSQEAGRAVGSDDCFLCVLAERFAGTRFPDQEVVNDVLDGARGRLAAMEAAKDRELLPETPFAALAVEEVPISDQPQLASVRPLRFSGRARLVTPAQRAYLLRRDGYCCVTPGCSNHIWLQVHHISFYCRGGITVPDNLLMICSRCHRNVHEGWLRISGLAPDHLSFVNRQGRSLIGTKVAGSAFAVEGPLYRVAAA